ncbi:MAG: GNVR domain-containing protein [Candidatus Eisenbacteria bacterium]
MEQQSILSVILGWRRLIVRVVIAAIIVSVVVSLALPSWYGASATFLPPQEGSSRGGLVQFFSQFGMDFGSAGLVSATPVSDLMIGVLKSRRLRERVVLEFDLASVYGSSTTQHAVRDLGEHMLVSTTPEGLVDIWVEDRDRERAAAVANAFLDLLDEYNRESSTEQASRTREYVEETLVATRGRLDDAAATLRDFQEEHGAIEIGEQTRVTVEATAGLEAERARLEIQRGLLSGFSSQDHVDVRRADAEIAEIDGQLAVLRGTSDGDPASSRSGVLLPLDRIPELGLRLADLTREVMVQEKVYEFLSSQLEEARIQESRDLTSIRVIDRAEPPLERARPRRKLIVILTVLLALIGSIGLAIGTEGLLDYASTETSGGPSRELRFLLRPLEQLKAWGGPPEASDRPSSRDS